MYSALESCPEFVSFLKAWSSDEGFRCSGAPGSSPYLILARAHLLRPRPLLILARDDRAAERVKREMESFGRSGVESFPALEVLERDEVKSNPELVGERCRIAAALRNSSQMVIATTPLAAAQPLPAPEEMEDHLLRFRPGDRCVLADLVRWLIKAGYEHADPVLIKGQFARRGGIVDVFSGQSIYPLRMELEGDRVASLRSFDPQSQSSRGAEIEGLIYPAAYSAPRTSACLWDYLPRTSRVALSGILSRETWEATLPRLPHSRAVYFSGIDAPCPGLDLPLRGEFSIHSLERFKYQAEGSVHPLLEAVPGWLTEGLTCLVIAHNDAERQRLREIVRERGIADHPRLRFGIGEADEGFLWEQARTAVVSDSEIFSRYRIRRPARVFVGGRPASAPSDFRPGDFVVHIDYGVGRYLGIKKIASGGSEREKMLLQFAGKQRLYVPLQQAFLISRYLGLGSRPPALDRLGGTRWRTAKLKAAQAADGLAKDLLDVQAQRSLLAGRAFPPDTAWQKEFEGAFIYPETPDQLAALSEIKADMESTRPMDRLLCGDVGYGKTEVAIRAAFKAATDGVQVAILVPTTILAQQHYDTFRERMADYPVRVAMLSRFLSPREQKAVCESLAQGATDIVIGTHRLLQADIVFKNLGLVIIDEEQRFGVRHKERLKQMRQLVDILTLTATPIPRTLYLSLTGARDLSSIATPPQDRLAVETRVTAYDPQAARRAIDREIRRQGQVYYLFNRVKGIEAVRDRIAGWFPGRRVEVAHAQMDEEDLASVMRRFARGKIDILVCTTIIESGLDIPNANTIIVERAERFGLADLYQLRGRVGRFKHRAYAYFFYPPFVFLEESARRRLQAIEEFSQLGAGFSLAVRDLEIRGAGNILGKQQHGHIAAVGFDLYCRLLERSVKRLKGEAPKAPPPAELDFEIQGALEPGYVADQSQRVEMYRRWAAATSAEEVAAWKASLRDRFGPLPEPAEILAEEALLGLAAGRAGADRVGRMGRDYVFRRGKEIVRVIPLPPASSPRESYRLLRKELEGKG
jgi:transcription-repair coupling factor (superfamily II helicase)